jgi:transcriptional regulator with XRE-family HTH domain
VSYILSKLLVLVPAQIRALRLKSVDPPMPYQRDLARESDLHQSRISMFETPGAANMTLETIAKIAAGLRVGVVVKFVPFSDMLRWENLFSPENDVVRLSKDEAFINPEADRSKLNGFSQPPANEGAGMDNMEEISSDSLDKPSPQRISAYKDAVGAN